MSGADEFRPRLGIPAQSNLARATEMAYAAVGDQPDEQLVWLGAQRQGSIWRLPVLGDQFHVDLSAGRITTSAGEDVGDQWSILALHYLAVALRPEKREPTTTFADLANARSYSDVYHGRVIGRLCATAGREAEKLSAAAHALGASTAEGGDLAFAFEVFPRVSLRLIWHAPDDEFPAAATLLLPDNVESYFCSEDIVVLSESLVSRLCGRPF